MLTAQLKLLLSTIAIISVLLGTAVYLLVREPSPRRIAPIPEARQLRTMDDRHAIGQLFPVDAQKLDLQNEKRQQKPQSTSTSQTVRKQEKMRPEVIQ